MEKSATLLVGELLAELDVEIDDDVTMLSGVKVIWGESWITMENSR